MSRRITIFDTTLRDGEQSPGASMSLNEKLAIAKRLAQLNVDVIEAGFPFSSPADFRSVQAIAEQVDGPIICGLCRANESDIVSCAEAIAPASRRRIHTFIGTSPLHVERKFEKTYEEVLELARSAVQFAKTLCDDVEFSAEDAMRTDREYLRLVVQTVIEAGATTVNIPDTVGYTMPWIMEAVIVDLITNVPNISQATISVHNHNDLGMATANSLAAIRAGAGQVECTINGIGERAGNCSLEEVVMALKTRSDQFDAYTDICTKHLVGTSKLVSQYSSFVVQPNKAIVGSNAFRHEAGIHQHGMLKDRQTYEIMDPADVGWSSTETALPLGPRSGKHGYRARLKELGYTVNDEELAKIYERAVALADNKKQVFDEDLVAIMTEMGSDVPEGMDFWSLVSLTTITGGLLKPQATMILRKGEAEFENVSLGNGPVDAAFNVIQRITGIELEISDYSVRSVTRGGDAIGEATIHVKDEKGREVTGRAADTDVVRASAMALVNAVNRLIMLDNGNGH